MRLCVFVLCIAFYLYNRMSFYNMHYTVPILKVSNVYGKSLTVEDFRGVSISPVISKVLEHCILDRYGSFFETFDNQFGFKKRLGCRDAVYTCRCIVD